MVLTLPRPLVNLLLTNSKAKHLTARNTIRPTSTTSHCMISDIKQHHSLKALHTALKRVQSASTHVSAWAHGGKACNPAQHFRIGTQIGAVVNSLAIVTPLTELLKQRHELDVFRRN